MAHVRVGIIGGTGLGDVLIQHADGESVTFETPFGPPSAPPVLAKWEGVDVAFIARHGSGHCLSPSHVPYRANIWTFKKLGVTQILASGATGSLREDMEPGHLVLCDQVIDKTFRRQSSFFDRGLAVHTEFAEPFCPRLRELLTRFGETVDTTVHHAGTYVCMEGPQFSTRAESLMHRQWGGDLIGMTCMPEARLAREAEICYALIALPTDYDCWRPPQPGIKQEQLLQEIMGNLNRATQNAINLIHEALKGIHKPGTSCGCRDALRLAIWSDKGKIDEKIRQQYDLLIGRYF